MKPSKFNHFIDIGDRHFIFNAFRRGLHMVEPEIIEAMGLLKEGSEHWNRNLSDDYMRQLHENGYVLDDDFDEHVELVRRREEEIRNNSILDICIMPTLSCNFGCPYCFEGQAKPAEHMTEQTMQNAITFIRSLVTEDTKSIRITWYGGEPLLGLNEIIRFTELVNDYIVHPLKLSYHGHITTNGYLLTKDVALQLKSLGVKTAQVTLDGMREFHDSRRYLKSGGATFDRIIDNLKNSCDILKITIRVNTDKENVNGIVPLIRYFKNEQQSLRGLDVYVAYMWGDGDASWRKTFDSIEDYSKSKIALHRKVRKFGMNILQYPMPTILWCGVSRRIFWVVAPNGDLHKCYEPVNKPEYAVGNVNSMSIGQEAVNAWEHWSPFNYEKCKTCDVLTLCMGHCTYRGLQNGKPECSEWKYILRDAIRQWILDNDSNSQIKPVEQRSLYCD